MMKKEIRLNAWSLSFGFINSKWNRDNNSHLYDKYLKQNISKEEMAMLKEIKGKVKETATEVKDLIVGNKELVAFYAAMTGVIVGGVVYGRHVNKKCMSAWRNAKQAFDNGQLDADFGPYKLMKFFEPKTGEFIGQTMCHKGLMEEFLKVK